MGRILAAFAGGAFAVLLLAGVGLVLMHGVIGPRVAEAAGFGPPFAADLPAEIRDLRNLPPDQRFGHFLGGQFRFSDTDNTAHTVAITPATVASLSGDKLTVTLNDGGAGKTYTLTSDTRIHTAGQPWNGGQGQTASPKVGDKVVVVTLDGNDTPKAVVIGGPDGFRPRGGPFNRG